MEGRWDVHLGGSLVLHIFGEAWVGFGGVVSTGMDGRGVRVWG